MPECVPDKDVTGQYVINVGRNDFLVRVHQERQKKKENEIGKPGCVASERDV